MSAPGFYPAPGTNYSYGSEPQIAKRLNTLAQALGLHLTGLSGYRTPAHSVAVGGFANDPHTRGLASDTPGIESVPESVLQKYGLTRPFAGAAEADHIQLSATAPTRSAGLVPPNTIVAGGTSGKVSPVVSVGSGLPSVPNPIPTAADIASAVLDAVFGGVASEAKYAALAFVAIIGGFVLIGKGLNRATHQEAPA